MQHIFHFHTKKGGRLLTRKTKKGSRLLILVRAGTLATLVPQLFPSCSTADDSLESQKGLRTRLDRMELAGWNVWNAIRFENLSCCVAASQRFWLRRREMFPLLNARKGLRAFSDPELSFLKNQLCWYFWFLWAQGIVVAQWQHVDHTVCSAPFSPDGNKPLSNPTSPICLGLLQMLHAHKHTHTCIKKTSQGDERHQPPA